MHKIALNFEDGVTRFVEAHAGETVADAAYRCRVNIPMDCRDGACGTCKCFCEAGAYELGSYLDDAMTEEEAREGYVLTCQMKAKSDCVVRVAASSAMCKVKPTSMPAEIETVRKLSASTIGVAIKMKEEVPSYLPGQYVNIGVPGSTQTRSYSFSSLPKDAVVEFLVRNIPGGLMSSYLSDRAAPGDALSITGPIGSFYLRDMKRPALFLAGGTGLAPFLAMLEKLMRDGASQPIHMIYGVTRDDDLVEVSRLEELAGAIPDFTFETVVADAASSHPRKGYVTHHLSDETLNGGDLDIYLCGPPPMVDAVRGYLTAKSITPVNFYYEKFSPSEQRG